MTDSPEERVIAEAMNIINGEIVRAEAESCPKGEECGVHYRVDESVVEEEGFYARFITYVGEFVVLTEDNPEVFSAVPAFLGALLGLDVKPPLRWETVVFHVGEGTLHDVAQLDADGQCDAMRYAHKHDTWTEVEEQHKATLIMLESGLLDVSKKWED